MRRCIKIKCVHNTEQQNLVNWQLGCSSKLNCTVSQNKMDRRRRRSTTGRTAWQLEFKEQRRLFRRNAEDYWRSTTAECRYDSRQLCE